MGAALRLYEAIQAGGRTRSGETGDLRGFLPLTGISYYPGGLIGLKRKKRVKFGYIEKKPYLCTVLVAERLRSDNPAIAPRRRLIRGELAVSGAPLAAGAFVY